RHELARRILEIEHVLFGLPRPDVVLLLDLTVSLAQDLIARKSVRHYTDRKADLQEADAVYLSRVSEMFHELARSDPHWRTIPVNDGPQLRSIGDVAADIWKAVEIARSDAPANGSGNLAHGSG